MPSPIELDVRNLLRNREPILNRIALDAWSRWWKNPERSQLFRRTRACLIHNYAMIDANTAFSGDKGIHLIVGQETTYFLVEDRLLFRFKKGDQQGLSSNVETQQSLAFVEPDQPLVELPDVARVDISYVVNPLETLIQSILVVARDGDRAIWSYPIYPIAAAAGATILPLPVQPKGPPAADNVVKLPLPAKSKQDKKE